MGDNLQTLLEQQVQIEHHIHTLYDKFQVSANEDEKEQIFFDIVTEVRKFKQNMMCCSTTKTTIQ
jgi:hypothetical protein